MRRDLIRAAEEYIAVLFRQDAGGHDAAHSMRVCRLAMRIADGEAACDREAAALAALLHDADDPKLFDTENNANARAFLEKNAVDGNRADFICRLINGVSFSRNRGARPDTPEGCIVQDADRLDAIGAVGIARTFSYGGAHGRSMEASLAHFQEKLLLLRDMMHTDTARRLARDRHAFLEAFLREWEREMRESGE